MTGKGSATRGDNVNPVSEGGSVPEPQGGWFHRGRMRKRPADLAPLAEASGKDGNFVQGGLLPTCSEAMVDFWPTLRAIAVAKRQVWLGALGTPMAAYRPIGANLSTGEH